jgi:hypothetical protein
MCWLSVSPSFFRNFAMPSKCDPNADFILVRALASGASIVKAAQMAGVSERTVHRKLNEPSFRQCLADVRWQIFDGSIGQLVAASREACDNLRELLKSPSDHVRLNACRLILTHVVKLKSEMENERRLSDIEAELNGPDGSARFYMESDPNDESEWADGVRNDPASTADYEVTGERQDSTPSAATSATRPAATSAPINQAPQSAVRTPENPAKSCQPTVATSRGESPEPVRRGASDSSAADRKVSTSSTPSAPKPAATSAPINQATQPAVGTPENPDKSCQPTPKPPYEARGPREFTDTGRRLTQAERVRELRQMVQEMKEQERKAKGG